MRRIVSDDELERIIGFDAYDAIAWRSLNVEADRAELNRSRPNAYFGPVMASGSRSDVKSTARREALVTTKGRDVAAAERWKDDHGHRFRYVPEEKRWYVYEGGVWRVDPDRIKAREAGEQTARDRLREAAAAPSEQVAALVREAQRSMTAGGLTAMLDVAEPHIAVSVADLDADPWLLNCSNGIVDTRTGELLEHEPERLMTRKANAAYKPGVEPSGFLRFLEEIIPDPEERIYLQRLLGSALVGVQRDHILPIFYGSGMNGKTTLITAVMSVLGDYAMKIPVSVLVGRNPDRGGASPELVKLRGVRLAVADEPEAGAPLREAHVKGLTGGDRIVARALYSDPIEFDPSHTLLIATNHRPTVRGSDEGIWRRLVLVPFTVRIPEESRDLDLDEKLAVEADGILSWLVEGCLVWQQRGLDPPALVTSATDAYRTEQDHIAEFIDAACELGERMRVPGGQIYKAYVAWCQSNGYEPLSGKAFGSDLTDRGFATQKSGGRNHRLGIALSAGELHEDLKSVSPGQSDSREGGGGSGQESPTRARGESSAEPSPTLPMEPDDELEDAEPSMNGQRDPDYTTETF